MGGEGKEPRGYKEDQSRRKACQRRAGVVIGAAPISYPSLLPWHSLLGSFRLALAEQLA